MISVVVPVHNEERSVALLYDELRSTLAEIRNLTEAEQELQQYTGPAGRINY